LYDFHKGERMNESIIAALDKEIASLQQARAILSGLAAPATQVPKATGRRGRPKGSKNAAKSVAVAPTPKAKNRVLSEQGRARISAALKKRHAVKKRAAKKAAAEQSAS
jgi:hypothetical protein